MTLATASQIAPIVTASIAALLAALVALGSIVYQGTIARRRAAIDFFLKTEMDSTAIALYEDFKKIAPRIKAASSMEKFSAADESKTRAFLNVCELIAVGIREHAFSERVSKEYWGDVLPESYRKAEKLIKHIRATGEGTHHTYIALEELCAKWEREESRLGWRRALASMRLIK